MLSLGFARLKALSAIVRTLVCLAVLLRASNASAVQEDSITPEDHNHPLIQDAVRGLDFSDYVEEYQSEFFGIDRSIIGRATSDQTLGNNAPGQSNIQLGASKGQFWIFPNETLFGPKTPQTTTLPSALTGQYPLPMPNATDERILYISLTTCDQPTPKVPDHNDAPGQLELYISTSSNIQEPDQSHNDYTVAVDGGYGSVSISVKSDVYFGVFAPNDDDFAGIYNYQLTASIDAFYASRFNASNVYFVDSDSQSALLYTTNLTNTNASEQEKSQWMENPPVFSIYIQNQESPSILGLQNSVCGLKNHAQIQGPDAVNASMTNAGASPAVPKQQFYIKSLDRSSSYFAYVTIDSNTTASKNGAVGGGGVVWSSNTLEGNFSTKSDGNCALIYNLPFCSQVAYAVPSNATDFNTSNHTALGLHYDNYTSSLYQNFNYSLQQIACDTTASAQYSLARNCEDCKSAYKQWLCAVSIPRCEDFSQNLSWLQPRAIGYPFINVTQGNITISENNLTFHEYDTSRYAFNQSRNNMIDNDIKPGPYKEVLPCKDLCYELVRSCPAALGFACPIEGHGLNFSYGDPAGGIIGHPRCNAPGVGLNGAAALGRHWSIIVLIAITTALIR